MKELRFKLNFELSINEFLALFDCLIFAARHPEHFRWPLQKQTINKLAKEHRRIWGEWIKWEQERKAANRRACSEKVKESGA